MKSASAPTYRTDVTKQQEFAHSSGATALLCAARELGRSELWEGSSLETDPGKAEGVLYRALQGLPPEAPLDEAGFSPLTSIIETAHRLGFKSYMHASRPEALVSIFGESISRALSDMKVHIEEGSELWLKPNQRRLRLVGFDASKPGEEPVPKELRYLMERPDDSVMNPATGQNHENPRRLNEASTTGKYSNTGVSLVLTDTQGKFPR